jgi:hypothetical protein
VEVIFPCSMFGLEFGISQEKVTSWSPGPGSLGGVDVMSARIWFDRTVPTETPANVFSRFRGQYSQDVLMGHKWRIRRDPDDRNGDEGSNIAGRKTGVQSTRSKSRSFDQPKRRLSPRSMKSSVLQKQPKLGISPI